MADGMGSPQEYTFRRFENGNTGYTKCVGCHICQDVRPTGYIQMRPRGVKC